MVTTRRCSVISRTVRVLGTETSIPDCRTGAVIMKMTSSTSTTSTSGVMLISASEVRVWPLLLVKATLSLPGEFGFSVTRGRGRTRGNLFEQVQQFAGKVVGGRGKNPDARGELVVSHHGRHGHKEAGRGGDERLRDAGGDGPQRRRSRRSQAVEGVDDADHRAEEADEGTGGGDGGQPGHAAFEGGNGFAGGGLRRALQGSQVARRSRAAGLPLIGLVDVFKDLGQGAEFVVGGERGNLLQASGLAEGADEAAALFGGLAEQRHLAQNHGPGVETGDEQQHQNGHGHGTDVVEHLPDRGGTLMPERGRGRRRRDSATISLQQEEEGSSKNRRSPHTQRYQTRWPLPSYRCGPSRRMQI